MSDLDLDEQLLLMLVRHLDGSAPPLTAQRLADQVGRPEAEVRPAVLALEKFRMVNVTPRSGQVTLRPLGARSVLGSGAIHPGYLQTKRVIQEKLEDGPLQVQDLAARLGRDLVELRPLLRLMVLIGDLRASQRDGEITHVALR